MHYHAEVGIPLNILGYTAKDEHKYDDVLADIRHFADFVLRKYQQDLGEHEMGEYGIEAEYFDEEGDECDGDDDGATAWNPEALWDWYTFGGRWKGAKAPPKYKDMFESEDSPEIISTPHGDRVKTFWDTLHTSLIGDDIGAPRYVMWLNEGYSTHKHIPSSIECKHIDEYSSADGASFKDILATRPLRWKDYVWVTCDLHY